MQPGFPAQTPQRTARPDRVGRPGQGLRHAEGERDAEAGDAGEAALAAVLQWGQAPRPAASPGTTGPVAL